MATEDERKYHLERAEAERALAAQSSCEEAIKAHIELAELHESKATKLTEMPWEAEGPAVLRTPAEKV